MAKYILSFGGGINSTAMYFLIRDRKLPLDEIIFADTGNELPETYATLGGFISRLEKDKIKFTQVRSKLSTSLYEYMWVKKTLPSRVKRDCTSKFKVSPIRKYLRETYGKKEKFVMYIGIALEEAHRMRTSDVSYIENVYPLVDNKIDREGCIKILNQNSFMNVSKSGCFFCPYTTKEGWRLLASKHPELLDKAIALEKNCKNKKVQIVEGGLTMKIGSWKNQTKIGDYACDIAGSCFL
jgi:hypothetical protein